MRRSIRLRHAAPLRRANLGALAVILVITASALSGCSIVKAVNKAVHTIEGNKSTIDAFDTKLQNAATTFEVTYTTTGSAPATVTYAVQPPTGVYFSDVPAANGNQQDHAEIIANQSGEYACAPKSSSGSSSGWKCDELPKQNAKTENEIFSFYTPEHWVTFLRDFALAAGFAGDKVSSSTMSVNGFSLNCVDLTAAGEGTSTVCSTSQGLLGYVKVAQDSTSFEITRYSSSPSSSLFTLPAGATVTKVSATTSTT